MVHVWSLKLVLFLNFRFRQRGKLLFCMSPICLVCWKVLRKMLQARCQAAGNSELGFSDLVPLCPSYSSTPFLRSFGSVLSIVQGIHISFPPFFFHGSYLSPAIAGAPELQNIYNRVLIVLINREDTTFLFIRAVLEIFLKLCKICSKFITVVLQVLQKL